MLLNEYKESAHGAPPQNVNVKALGCRKLLQVP